MMIDVKATRNAPEDASATNPYVAAEEQKQSSRPLIFALLLTGLVLYIRYIFSDASWSQPAQPDPDREEPVGPQERAMAATMVAPATQAEAKNIPEPAEGNIGPRGGGAPIIDLHTRASFTIMNPDIELPVLALPEPLLPTYSGGAFVGAEANDNGSVPGVTGAPGLPGRPTPGAGDAGQDDGEDEDDDDDGETESTNRAPRVSGPVFLSDATVCAAVVIGLSDLLRNASDPDGDPLSVKGITVSSGTLTQTLSGWLYDPAGPGPVTITYRISDGALSVVQTAYLNMVSAAAVIGTGGDDVLVGSACADDIDGRDGDDNIDARGGDDTINGGHGNDHIVAGDGNDIVFAGTGHDIVFGGRGNDWISGGKGNDRLFGEDGDDVIFGDEGDDLIDGGAGDDQLFGGTGNDAIAGGSGDDRLHGGDGDDRLEGGGGNDFLMGGAGHDRLFGEDGDDVIFGDEGDDLIDGGAGDDQLFGGTGNDAIASGSGDDRLHGGDGDDRLEGGGGNDLLMGGAGHDRLFGEDGEDVIFGEDGDDVLSGGSGEDQVWAGAGDDVVIGDLDAASDIYNGGGGEDTLDYSAATKSIHLDLKEGRVSGLEIGEDTISNFEAFVGGKGDDHFRGGGHAAKFQGGDGNDVFEFGIDALSATGERIVYEILDFMAGDRVRISRYDLFEKVMDSLEDRFEEIYGDDVDDDDLPIRIRHERTDDIRMTLVEADFDGDDIYELAITIHGEFQVTVTQMAGAVV